MSLSLLRLYPDPQRLVAWGVRNGCLPAGVDNGYALHAITRAALGDYAPRPFAFIERGSRPQLLGYVGTPAQDVLDAAMLPPVHDAEAAAALALGSMEARAMPDDWREGQMFGFELRVRPIVRTRPEGRHGATSEIDAALHARSRDPGASAESTYRQWLEARLGEAATLLELRIEGRRSVKVLRRHGETGERRAALAPGPDVLFRGILRVGAPGAFAMKLAHGVGRHAAFGFGCLLLAPPGTI